MKTRAFVVALALLASAPALSAEDAVPPLVHALDTSDSAARTAAAAALRDAPDADTIIVDWLRDGPRRSKLGAPALQALAELAGERGLKLANSGLRALLRDTQQPLDVRRAAANALGKNGSIADVAALGDALKDVPDESARALVAIGGEPAIAVLRQAGGDAPSPEIVAALAKLGDRERLRALVAELDDAAKRDRAGALLKWATGRDLPAEKAAWTDFVRRDDLAAKFTDPDAEAAQRFVLDLVERRKPSTEPPTNALEDDLAAILSDTNFPAAARARAALVIGLRGDRTRNAVLLAACANGQPGDVRRYAADAIARVGDLSCVMPLANMLVHDEDRDRLAAKRTAKTEFVPVDPAFVRALYRIGVRGGPVALIDLLDNDYRTGLHRDCLRAIAEVSGGDTFAYQPDGSKADRSAGVDRIRAWWREARDTIPLAVRHDDPGWDAFRTEVDKLVQQLAALKFLYQFRAKKALMIVAEPASVQLVAALSNDDLHIRMGTAEVMEGTALRDFAAPLAARLADEKNGAVRTKLLSALETCGRRAKDGSIPGGSATLEAVRGALGDRDLDVRIASARALGVMGDASDLGRLRAFLAEKRNAIPAARYGAASSLLLLRDKSAVRILSEELREDDVALRAEALRVLRLAGVDVHGFNVDGTPEAREQAVKAIEADVPPEERR